MQIQQIQNNNTNFQGLHMDKTARKWLGKDILNIPGIKECADKFEVVVKSECKFPLDMNIRRILCAIFAGCGASISGMFGFVFFKNQDVPILLSSLGPALIGSLIYKTMNAISTDRLQYNYELQVGKNIKKSCLGNVNLKMPLSRKCQINPYELTLNNDTNIIQIVKDNDQRQFMNIIQKYDKNNIYEPKYLLKILNNKEIKQNYKNGECFNYKLENNSNDTMLTKFLDIVPTEENEKDYQEIIKFMRKAKNIDYKQVDSNGISAIEKIINSENPDLLDLVKDTEFDYSRELDYAYERIDNNEFKDKVKNLNINFPNVKEAIRLNSTGALQKLLPEFKSPFFNTKKLVNDLSGKVAINNLNNAITFLEDNGIDTAGVII